MHDYVRPYWPGIFRVASSEKLSCLFSGELFNSVSSDKGLTLLQFAKIGTAQLNMLIVIGCAIALTLNIPILALHLKEQVSILENYAKHHECLLLKLLHPIPAGSRRDRCRILLFSSVDFIRRYRPGVWKVVRRSANTQDSYNDLWSVH